MAEKEKQPTFTGVEYNYINNINKRNKRNNISKPDVVSCETKSLNKNFLFFPVVSTSSSSRCVS